MISEACFDISVKEKHEILSVFIKFSFEVLRYFPFNSFLSENATA
jgi:hypothetical protein